MSMSYWKSLFSLWNIAASLEIENTLARRPMREHGMAVMFI